MVRAERERPTRRVPGVLALAACVALVAGPLAGCRSGDASRTEDAATDAGLPSEVTRAWRSRHPAATLESARSAAPIDGAPGGYVVVLRQESRPFELVIGPAGALVAVREPIGMEHVPPAVTAAARAEWPDDRPTGAQREVRDPHGASVELVRLRLSGRSGERWEVFHGNGQPWRGPLADTQGGTSAAARP